MTTLQTKKLGKLEGEYFAPTREVEAHLFAREHGVVLYSLVGDEGVFLEKSPTPESELLGFVALGDLGESVELETIPSPA